MRLARPLIPLKTLVLLLALPLFCVAYCQENSAPIAPAPTLLSRLKDVKFVGIPTPRDPLAGDGVKLVAISEEQHTAYREAIAKEQSHRREYDKAREAARQELQEAIDLKESPEVIARFQQDVDRYSLIVHNKRIRQSNYREFGSNVYRVVSVGLDYVEIAGRTAPESTDLIPLSQIRGVVFRKDLPKFEVMSEAKEE